MGGATNANLRALFAGVRLPATIEQLRANSGVADRILATRTGNGVITDGDRYWLTEEVLDEGITHAEKMIAAWQVKLLDLQAQRATLTAKSNTELRTLFADYQSFSRRSNHAGLIKECSTKDDFPSWNCCNTHRSLAQEHAQLKARAEKLAVPAGDAQPLSLAWWEAAGINPSTSDYL